MAEIKILTISHYSRVIHFNQGQQIGAVTAVTYLDPNGERSAASMNGNIDSQSAKRWLTRMWEQSSNILSIRN